MYGFRMFLPREDLIFHIWDFSAEHRVWEPVQHCCPGSAPILSRCWQILVLGQRRLLPYISQCQRLRGKFKRTEGVNSLLHRRLWNLDKDHSHYPKICYVQVRKHIFNLPHKVVYATNINTLIRMLNSRLWLDGWEGHLIEHKHWNVYSFGALVRGSLDLL